ncbi:hypothetical protein GOODEAATRI_010081 [Goodea atripinnis]|uniref:Uncharacterized protein n=1 Tax=Goodea atripinnis TaxID=208336 RepID=A0ABV0N044_9TELE
MVQTDMMVVDLQLYPIMSNIRTITGLHENRITLYELMIMAFKYQVFLCPRPKDLLLISYNHIDTIREFVRDTPVVMNQVDETHRNIIEVHRYLGFFLCLPLSRQHPFTMSDPFFLVFVEVYSSLSEGQFQLLRQTLLIFFQDMHIRPDSAPNPLAKEELNQLARLMGSMKAENVPKRETQFLINLFTTDQEEEA